MRTWCNPTLESLIDLAGQGDVVPLSGFGVPFYVLCHPSPIEEVLRQKSRLFRKDAYLDALRPMLGNGLFTSEGNEWRRQRAAAQPQFAARQIQQYAGTMVEYADRLISG
jgi:cytochrome P450